MADFKLIQSSTVRLFSYMAKNEYKGYDQYDVLSSPLFKQLVFKNRTIRFISQQTLRRLPVNLRPLLGVNKEINPVTLGLVIQSYSYLSAVFPEKKLFFNTEIEKLKKSLIRFQSKGYSGLSWGYNFDWEARYASIDAYVPTSVATGIITNGLFEHYRLTGDISSFKMCEDASKFILNDLNRSYEGENFCFSYSPKDKQHVFNASMKATRLLAQVFSVNKDKYLKEEAYKTVKYVVLNQRENGSWGYANHDARTWTDNYHTAYILDCLEAFIRLTGYNEFNVNLEKGIKYYRDNFFYENKIPKFRDNKLYPVDSTGIGQSLLTLTRFGFMELANNIAKWSVENMQADEGYFYFRKNKYYTNKIPYMRWSNAWMLVGLAFFLYKTKLTKKL